MILPPPHRLLHYLDHHRYQRRSITLEWTDHPTLHRRPYCYQNDHLQTDLSQQELLKSLLRS